MTQMVLNAALALPATGPSGISSSAERPPLPIRIANGLALAGGGLLALHFSVASGLLDLAITAVITVASLAYVWFRSRRKRRLAQKPAAVAVAVPADQGGLS
jgi:hypothetical protein